MSALFRVIQYTGDNNVLVARSEIEDFNTHSQLIVNESQEALFYKNGEALDLFQSGRHDLKTANIPLLRRVIEKAFAGDTPFPCTIYFINKITTLDLKWGTDSPIYIRDPEYLVRLGLRANGQAGIRISDSRKFVVKLVGQMPECTVESVRSKIKGNLMTQLRATIARTIEQQRINVFQINSYLPEISDETKKLINERLEEYGIEVTDFYVNQISPDENDDNYKAIDASDKQRLGARTKLDIDEDRTIRMGEAMAKSRAAQGYTYQDERKFDVLEKVAQNESPLPGTIMGAGVGMGMSVGVGATIGRAVNEVINDVQQSPVSTATASVQTKACFRCGAALAQNMRFCPECGAQQPVARFCPQCGEKLGEAVKFCSSCGAKVGG